MTSRKSQNKKKTEDIKLLKKRLWSKIYPRNLRSKVFALGIKTFSGYIRSEKIWQ